MSARRVQPARYLVVDLEFVAHPGRGSQPGRHRRQTTEIVELGGVLVDSDQTTVLAEAATLVRPDRPFALPEDFVALTGIQQAELDAAGPLDEGLASFTHALGLTDSTPLVFCAWGGVDHTLLRRALADRGLPWHLGRRHLDLARAFSRQRRRRWENPGLTRALELMGLPRGQRHRALADARAAAQLLPWCTGKCPLPPRALQALRPRRSGRA